MVVLRAPYKEPAGGASEPMGAQHLCQGEPRPWGRWVWVLIDEHIVCFLLMFARAQRDSQWYTLQVGDSPDGNEDGGVGGPPAVEDRVVGPLLSPRE